MGDLAVRPPAAGKPWLGFVVPHCLVQFVVMRQGMAAIARPRDVLPKRTTSRMSIRASVFRADVLL